MRIIENPLEIIDPYTAMANAISTAFGIREYLDIVNSVKDKDFNADRSFRKRFNAYYKVRQRKPEWYEKYYQLMVEQKKKCRSFGEVLRSLSSFGSIEVSFSSKMIAAVDPDKPIWDKYVVKNLGLEKEWKACSRKPMEDRIEKAESIYDGIEQWYAEFINSTEGKLCIKKFDEILPEYKVELSNTKKIDFLLVFKRDN